MPRIAAGLLGILILSMAGNGAFADVTSKALEAAADTAVQLCDASEIRQDPESSLNPHSGKFSRLIRSYVDEFSNTLHQIGMEAPPGAVDAVVPSLQRIVLYSLNDRAICRQLVLGELTAGVILRPDAIAGKKCRIPDNGVERYQSEATVTRESGWRQGGYSPTQWCRDVVSIVRAESRDADVEVVSSAEKSRDACAPFNCRQYNYACIVRVRSNPIYFEKQSPFCK